MNTVTVTLTTDELTTIVEALNNMCMNENLRMIQASGTSCWCNSIMIEMSERCENVESVYNKMKTLLQEEKNDT